MTRTLRSTIACEPCEPRRMLASVPSGFAPDAAYGGAISAAMAMEFSPDGRLWVLQQTGTVRVIQPNATSSSLAATLAVDSTNNRGLLGIAFDPAFGSSNQYVYIYRTIPSSMGGPYNRISRFTVSGNTINTSSEATILNLNSLGDSIHNGGAIHFGADGKLYVPTGENNVPSLAQSLTSFLGKILRLNPNPSNPIPTDNPTSFPGISGTTSGNYRAIWAVGLRNPFTFDVQPGTGRMHVNDVGQDAWEEVNLGQAGRNYGWPMTEGPNPPGNANVTYPIYSYANSGSAIAITGGSFYNPGHSQFGTSFTGDYFFADLGTGWIRRLDAQSGYTLVTGGGVGGGSDFLQGGSSIVDTRIGSDGALYFLQRGTGNGGAGVRVVRRDEPQVSAREFLYRGNTLPNPPHRLQFRFTTNVGASVGTNDLSLQNLDTGATVPASSLAVSYDSTTNTATFTFPGFSSGILPDADYRATLLATGVSDADGDPLPGNAVLDFFVLTGDADHNGVIDFDDYVAIDTGFNGGFSGFENGDFDYDGDVDFDDYVLIDLAFNNQ